MKTRFSTLDIIAILPELKAKICTGWRVNQVYDCDHKTYIFKLNKSIIKMKKDDDPLSVSEETSNKMSFIIESGLRMHTTDFDWPKSHAPSYFATKLRKAIRNKRIEDISQVGIDRAVDIQFGSNVAACHLIVELYDKGNLVLTDSNYEILAILRWRKPTDKAAQGTDVDQKDSENFRVGDKYPLHLARKKEDLEPMTEEKIIEMLNNARILLGSSFNYKKRNKLKQQTDDGPLEINLKDLFNPYVVYGSSLLEDRLIHHVFNNKKVTKCSIKIESGAFGRLNQEQVQSYAKLIKKALDDADNILADVRERQMCPGFVVQKREDSKPPEKLSGQNSNKQNGHDRKEAHVTNVDFFPLRSCAERRLEQDTTGKLALQEFESFDKAVDVYYSNLESQKIDSQALSAEREAMKKLGNLKIAQEKRLDDLARVQKEDEEKARLIELNCDKVENALLVIRSMIANQISWSDIWDTIREAQSMNDPIASLITGVKFDRNEFTMKLCDPYDDGDDCAEEGGQLNAQDEENDPKHDKKNKKNKKKNNNRQNEQGQSSKYKNVDIDISLSAHANARKFFIKRRTAVNKEKKTVEVAKKAFKNVERQTKERLKDVKVKTNITKARKRYWFENFFWFISSDGYLVVAGRDSEQNELLVKRYMKNNDIYVHADLHGASSVIIKNESTDPVPPKTLTEAGSMAVCYSSAWDSKIATTSWWVYPKQVSKTAPTGEYLTQGAFVIRGKKNYLPLSNLVLGFGFLFRLGEESIERRKKERLARSLKDQHSKGTDEAEQNSSGSVASSDDESIEDAESSDEEVPDKPKIEQTSNSEATEPPSETRENSSSINDIDNDDEAGSNKGEHDVDEYDDDEFDDEDITKAVEHRLIDTLTESPTAEDVLLYSIPMCGPYSALQSFKYKVKVVPGANKRGKAAKSCLTMFLHDKRATQRERDLLRAIKDQDYARNIPNKVKLSAPNLKSVTKKAKRPKKSEIRLPQRT
uniref:Nuclear export mediator factor Nemf n=1 Tax=Aceria tosichella TaxID=561515 RepID=A0A6G1SM14_9ACAR